VIILVPGDVEANENDHSGDLRVALRAVIRSTLRTWRIGARDHGRHRRGGPDQCWESGLSCSLEDVNSVYI
jgi:hypothetical protein